MGVSGLLKTVATIATIHANKSPSPRRAFGFTPDEAIELQDASRAVLLARWVAKEAHAKCLGIASRIEAAEIKTRTVRDRLHVVSSFGNTGCVVRRHDNTVQGICLSLDRLR